MYAFRITANFKGVLPAGSTSQANTFREACVALSENDRFTVSRSVDT